MGFAAGSWARRRGRAALLLVASACYSSGGSGSCDPLANGALNQGRFGFACSSSDPSQPNPDAYCATVTGFAGVSDVAVGAPFRLQFDQENTPGPQPAVPALANAGPMGWSIASPGWLGFVIWSGSDVLDYTHVRARTVASLEWDSSPTTWPLAIGGGPATVALSPLADDRTVLGGAIACNFASSDPSVASVTSPGGRVARLTANAPGEATLTASCMGAQIQAPLHVSGPGTTLEDATDDSEAGTQEDAPNGSALDSAAENEGSVAADDAGPNDASSLGPSADAEGGS
jgi:hypothetical protein